MKSILGVTNHSAFEVREHIEAWKAELPEERRARLVTQFLGFGHEVKAAARVILVPTLQCAIDNIEAIEETDAVVIVFDSPIILAQAHIKTLDAETKDRVRWTFLPMTRDSFLNELRAALNGRNSASFEPNFALVPNLLNSVQGSLTQMLLNLTMRSRVPERRRDITKAYVGWLLSSQPLSALLERLRGYGMDESTLEIISSWFLSKHGAQAKKICAAIAARQRDKKPINYEKLCENTTVEPFDLKFLLRHARTLRVSEVDQTSQEMFDARRRAAKNTDAAAQEVAQIQDELINQEHEMGVEFGELDFEGLEDISY